MDIASLTNELFQAYDHAAYHYPFLTNVGTVCVMFPLGDSIAQKITIGTVDKKKLAYTVALSPVYGAGTYCLVESGELVGEVVSEHSLVKAALGPNFWGNIYNSFFFVNNQIGEKTGYSVRKLAEYYGGLVSKIQKSGDKDQRNLAVRAWQSLHDNYIKEVPWPDYKNALVATLTAWNAFFYVNYEYIPEHLRTPMTLGVSVLWVTALSLWPLRGRKRIDAIVPENL